MVQRVAQVLGHLSGVLLVEGDGLAPAGVVRVPEGVQEDTVKAVADEHAIGVGRIWTSFDDNAALLASCAELHEVTFTDLEPVDRCSDGTDKELEPVIAQGWVLNAEELGTPCFLSENVDKLGQIASSIGCVEQNACS